MIDIGTGSTIEFSFKPKILILALALIWFGVQLLEPDPPGEDQESEGGRSQPELSSVHAREQGKKHENQEED